MSECFAYCKDMKEFERLINRHCLKCMGGQKKEMGKCDEKTCDIATIRRRFFERSLQIECLKVNRGDAVRAIEPCVIHALYLMDNPKSFDWEAFRQKLEEVFITRKMSLAKGAWGAIVWRSLLKSGYISIEGSKKYNAKRGVVYKYEYNPVRANNKLASLKRSRDFLEESRAA